MNQIKEITLEDIMIKLTKPSVKIRIINLDDITYVHKRGEVYWVSVNNNLHPDLLWYFMFHEIVHILLDDVVESRVKHRFCEFDSADVFTLKAYIEQGGSKKAIETSELLEDKLLNPEFKQIFDKW